MDLSADKLDLLALHLVPGLGPRLTMALLERFGSAAAVLRAAASQLGQVPRIGANLADKLRQAMDRVDVAAELERMQQHQVQLLFLGEPDYPAALASIDDPPRLLYVCGSLTPADANAVAVVGSRHCSSYGRRVAERMAAELAQAGFTVVSGLARGIDGLAHRAALEAKGRTLAVLAGGLARIYPPEHQELAQQVSQGGALISEASMTMEPMAGMFPQRNRIISGLCRAVVVVEAGDHSGTLITARHAAEQGREVFAIPGPVDNPYSAGTLKLLRQGAKPVRSAADVLEDLDGVAPLVPASPKAAASPPPAPSPPALEGVPLQIWQFLESSPHYIDDIARHLQLPIAELSRHLTMLEMKKVVRRLPGNQYERFR